MQRGTSASVSRASQVRNITTTTKTAIYHFIVLFILVSFRTTGENCSVNIDECESEPCQNGGACEDAVNGYACTCSAGFLGECPTAGAQAGTFHTPSAV